MDNKFEINIRIEGRVYPLIIDRKDEEKHRLAAKRVNETIEYFKDLFRDKDLRDIMAMTAIQLALEISDLTSRQNDALFIDELKNLNDDISDFLREKEKE